MSVAISIRNLDAFIVSLDRWVEKVEDETMHVANGLTVELFKEILQKSPQYSGDFAANWQYSINRPNTTFQELNLIDQGKGPFSAGERQAVTYARMMNKGRDSSYRIGDTFYLSNSAHHDGPYALKIENNQVNFRRWVGNTGATVHNAFATVLPQYRNISRMQARALARRKL